MIKADEYNNALSELTTAQINRGITDATYVAVSKDSPVSASTGNDNATLISNQSRLCYTDVPLPPSVLPSRGRKIYKEYLDGLVQVTADFNDKISCSDCFGTCLTACTGTCSGSCSGNCAGGCNGFYCQGSCNGAAAGTAAACGIFFPVSLAALGCNPCNFACGNNCRQGCGGGCLTGCSSACSKNCKANCYQTCDASCSDGCSNSARLGAFPYQNASTPASE